MVQDTSLLSRILREAASNYYEGSRLALPLLTLLLLGKTAMSVNCIFRRAEVATNADAIPLASFSPGATSAIVYLFASWALMQLTLCVAGWVVLLRYRMLIPGTFIP